MTPARLRWGLLLIMIGGLIMLSKADVYDIDVWSYTFTFFPIFLIAVGVEKIFTRSKYQVIAYAAPVFLVAAGTVLAFSDDTLRWDAGYIESQMIVERFDDEIRFVEAVIDLGEGDLTIRDATDELWRGRFREFSSKPEYVLERVGDSARIMLANSSNHKFFGGAVRIETDEPDDWRLELTNQVPVVLECFGRESEIHLNLAQTKIQNLNLVSDRSDVYVKLGSLMPEMDVSIAGSDTKLRLRVPHKVGLRVTGLDDPGYLYEIGLLKSNGAFFTSGYDTLKYQIDVDLDNRLQSLIIDYY